jgi:hypothetical protein
MLLLSQPSYMNQLSTNVLTPASVPTATDALNARRREVENALLVQALCERRPSLIARVQLLRYIAGELSREQAFADLYEGMY